MFRPCIDLHDGKVKQIVGSSLTDSSASSTKVNFETTRPAASFAAQYAEANLPGGHVIMLGPGNEPHALAALQAFPQGLQVGGGITPGNAQKYLEAGASHVIVTSFVFTAGKLDEAKLRQVVDVVGKRRLVLDLSCRRRPADAAASPYYVVTDRWQNFTDLQVSRATLCHLAQFCDEFLVHGVDVEGKRQGILDDLVEQLGAWSPIKVTYAGGVRSLADMDRVRDLGGGRVDVSVGSALDIFGGELKWEEVLEWVRTRST